MIETKVEITFSNNEKVILDQDTLLFPIKLIELNNEKFTTKATPIEIRNFLHIQDGFIPELTSIFALNEFFTLNTDDPYETKVYKSNSIVSLRQFT